MINNILIKQWKTKWEPWNLVVKFWFLTPNDEDVLLFSHRQSQWNTTLQKHTNSILCISAVHVLSNKIILGGESNHPV